MDLNENRGMNMSEEQDEKKEEILSDDSITPETPPDEEPKGDRSVLFTALGILVVLAAAFGIYYFLIYRKPAKPAETPAMPPAAVEEKQAPSSEPTETSKLPPVALDESDGLVRQLARELSSHPRLAGWLRSGQLIRHFVGAVDNIANGLSPRSHIKFFMPEGEFKVIKTGNVFIADPDGFNRYHPAVDVFVSLDSGQCAALFRGLKPLCQEAYRDLGYPNQDFEATLVRAIRELLETPIVDGDIILEKAVLNYTMLDPNLENLTDAQKHLLRMGPENVEAIQKKLREMAAALGVPPGSLPVARHYTTAP
jgi:hypothetical protein